jgi:nucleotide-binding universal stress UspA family protein
MVDEDRARRIVVGVDGSVGSLAALRWAVREAAETGGEVYPVLAYDNGLAWTDLGSESEPVILERAASRARETLDDMLEAIGGDGATVVLHPMVVDGPPARVLVDLGRDADLLVVGTRGRGGFAGLLLGSVSQRCAEQAHCPVVVVPPPDAAEPRDERVEDVT